MVGTGVEAEAKLPGFWAAIPLPGVGSPSHRSPRHGKAYPASLFGVSALIRQPVEQEQRVLGSAPRGAQRFGS